MTKYMVVETFHKNSLDQVYQRFQHKGRMLSDGLHYIDSWLSADKTRCFQLMETDRFELFQRWTQHWKDLADFEIVAIGKKPVP
ncbi:MAG: DUF3303 domain-containing protein [Gammaproteobacteria bacterium]|nr:DUF3303 domain-containing protein [Gammaproteobacteria bacterium]